MVDTSYSIGKSSFNRYVKPFVERFVKHPSLNVREDGTRIAIILFGQQDRTEIMLPFGEEYDANNIAKKVNNLEWEDIKGERTRTDLAFEIANQKVYIHTYIHT